MPPTPNPLASASILGFDLSYIIVVGMLVGLLSAMVAMFIWFKLLDRPKFWNVEKDETGMLEITVTNNDDKNLPSPWSAFIPIILPVICILIGSFLASCNRK